MHTGHTYPPKGAARTLDLTRPVAVLLIDATALTGS